MIDIVLLVLYAVTISCSWYIIHCHRDYFYERFQKGVVSLFMLAMLFFLLAYTFNTLIVLLAHLLLLIGAASEEWIIWLKFSWAFAQLGTTGGILLLAVLTRSGKYDQFVHIKKNHRKGGQHADSDTGEK